MKKKYVCVEERETPICVEERETRQLKVYRSEFNGRLFICNNKEQERLCDLAAKKGVPSEFDIPEDVHNKIINDEFNHLCKIMLRTEKNISGATKDITEAIDKQQPTFQQGFGKNN